MKRFLLPLILLMGLGLGACNTTKPTTTNTSEPEIVQPGDSGETDTTEPTEPEGGDPTSEPGTSEEPGDTTEEGGEEELQLVKTLNKSFITITDDTQKTTSYAAYAGEHDVEGFVFTTSDILAGAYVETDVIQFKAALGKLEFANDGYKKVVLKCMSTYAYDKNFTINGEIGTNDVINENKEDTGKVYSSKGTDYPVYLYTLEVNIADEAEKVTIEKTKGTSGAGYVTVIELYK